MQINLCDWEPCPWLKRLVESFTARGSKAAVINLVPPTREGTEKAPLAPVIPLNLWYCPFCGTRIHDNKDILVWIERKMRPLRSA